MAGRTGARSVSPIGIPLCHDTTCEQRDDCMLWGETYDPHWTGFSLRPFDQPIGNLCPHFADREAA